MKLTNHTQWDNTDPAPKSFVQLEPGIYVRPSAVEGVSVPQVQPGQPTPVGVCGVLLSSGVVLPIRKTVETVVRLLDAHQPP